MPRRTPRPEPVTIFTRHQFAHFASLPDDEQIGLREFAVFYRIHGRTPGTTARSTNGFPVGQWYAKAQANPHVLAEPTRAFLLSIPGVWLSKNPPRRRGMPKVRSKTEKFMYGRLMRWSKDPMSDPVTARIEKLRLNILAQAEAGA